MRDGIRNRIKETALSILYPRRCPVCHDIVMPAGELICPSCKETVSFVGETVCLRCGKEIAAKEIEYCYDCSRHERSFERGYALAVYDDVMRQSVRQFKNGGRIEYGDWYAKEIWERCGQELKRLEADALVPVPLHRSRQAERGYNQAEQLARRLGKHLGLPVWPGALRRIHRTTAQKYLGAGERSRNLESAFAPGKQQVTGRTVILVDDIYTTGGTAQECTKVLLEAGAEKVYLVNVCIGENDG